MEDYGSSDEHKPAAVGQHLDAGPVTSTTAPTQVNMDRMVQLRDTWPCKVRISLTSAEYATIVLQNPRDKDMAGEVDEWKAHEQ